VARRKVWARTDYQETMSFRLRQGLNALVTLCAVAACNTYTPDLLESGDAESTDDGGETSDSTLTTAGGVSTSNLTTTVNNVTTTNSTTGGGDGGSASDTTTSQSETTTDSGGSGGDTTTGSSTTDTDTDTTSTTGTTDTGGSGGSGSGGVGGSGGSGGSGGTTTSTGTTSVTIDVLLIDDLEDGNNQLETPTYSGYWFTTVDESGAGSVTPEPGERCDPEDLETQRDGSKRAMHVAGTWTDSTDWIAALGFALQDDEVAVDASSYSGVTFYARTDDPETAAHLQVMITDVKDDGHFAIELALTSDWQQHTVLWNNPLLIQPTWADEVDFDASNLFKFQFQFDSEAFDLWVDDIRFIEP